jgi:hypothetical protein
MSNTQSHEKHPHSNKPEKNIDEAVEDTFPASDPPSIGGTTKIVPDEPDTSRKIPSSRPPHDANDRD